MTATFVTAPVPAIKVRRGDVIDRVGGEPERIVAADRVPFPAITIRTETGTFAANPYDEVPLRVPVGRPVDGVGLYKADGSGVFGCVCVYRAPGGGQMHEPVAEDPACPAHGVLGYDDEWD